MNYFSDDDIAQIGTPPGPARVGALRLSGPNAFEILRRVTTGLEDALAGTVVRSTRPCRFLLSLSVGGECPTGRRKLPCPARAFLMPAPASYTREDVAEIHLPGSPVILRAALAAFVEAGARAAAPGEFTFRAFRNGRLSLNQAEAVESVIRAGTDGERRRALSRLEDRGIAEAAAWRDRLMDIAAAIEAALDFSGEELEEDVSVGLADLAADLAASGAGIALGDRDAGGGLPHVALVGLANAGKSSLMNRLLGEETVLVSNQPSTTRDSVRREVEWNGVKLLISDNPGFIGGEEDKAAARAFRSMGGEDVACWVLDSSRPPTQTDRDFAAGLRAGVLIVLNKCDLPPAISEEEAADLALSNGLPVVRVLSASAVTGEGIETLRECLAAAARSTTVSGPWSRREMLELAAAGECCRAAARELGGAGRLELAAEDLRRGVAAFSRALGEGYAEEALERIFSRFCIGK